MEFTRDMFSEHKPLFEKFLARLRGQPNSLLEVGCLEGRATCWMLDELCEHPNSVLTCVDAWRGVGQLGDPEHEARFDANIAEHPRGEQVRKLKGLSSDVLRYLEPYTFHFAYIDASHEARNVIMDLALVWPAMKYGGIVAMDDYDRVAAHAKVQAKEAIDFILRAWNPTILHIGAQVWVQKHEGAQ